MIVSDVEVRGIYEKIVMAMGHPDPIGYITRAIMCSAGESQYIGGDGKMGFMPIEPERAKEMVGSENMLDLYMNVMTTVTIDMMYFSKYNDLDDMVIAFHWGEEMVKDVGEYSGEQKQFLKNMEEGRQQIINIVSPPRATVEDVMRMIRDEMMGKNKPKKIVLDLVNLMLGER